MKMRKQWTAPLAAVAAIGLLARPAWAMHISEGILPPAWAGLWFVLAAPFVGWGLVVIGRRRARQSSYLPTLAMVGAAVFLISCMPIPLPGIGSCSHPCGTGLAAILVGPAPAVVLSLAALLLQALFMAHGGLGTLGANVFTMGVMGAMSGYAAFVIVRRLTGSRLAGAFAAGLLADWVTYAGTALALSTALHGSEGMWPLFLTICGAFAWTQIPLGLLEGLLTAGAYRFLVSRRPELFERLRPSDAPVDLCTGENI
jgi:cobalt/nickel transport system permease protein